MIEKSPLAPLFQRGVVEGERWELGAADKEFPPFFKGGRRGILSVLVST